MIISQIRKCYFGAAKNRIVIGEPKVQGEGNKINHRHCQARNKGKKCNTESEVISMLEFRIDDIFVECRGDDFQKNIGMPKGTKLCLSLTYRPLSSLL